MQLVWGVVVVVLSLVCWGGQVVSWFAPATAGSLGLTEAEADVEPMFWADGRGEALWDVATLWPMVVTGILLAVDHGAWPYFGLGSGGAYLYFAGRGITTRIEMQRRGFRIGDQRSVRVGMAALAVWGAMAAVTIAASVITLRGA